MKTYITSLKPSKTNPQSSQLQIQQHLIKPNPDLFLSDNYAVIDFETKINDHTSLLLACCYVSSVDTYYYSFGNIYSPRWEFGRFVGCDFIVCHNSSFELMVLDLCGFDTTSKPVYCTMVGEHVLAGNTKVTKTLEASCERHGIEGGKDVLGSLFKYGYCPSKMDRDELLAYCFQDVWLTHQLFLRQREALRKEKLLAVHYSKCLLTPVLVDIQKNGMTLDREVVEKMHSEVESQEMKARMELNNFTGGINPRSALQLRNYLYDHLKFPPPKLPTKQPWVTDKGEPSTSKEAIASLKAKTKAQKTFKALLTESKKLGNSLITLEKMRECSAHSGVLHAHIGQTTAVTHRLNSRGDAYKLQFQNLDSRFRGAFKASREGYVIVDVDLSQLEYRVAMWLGNDTLGLENVRTGVDIHSVTARAMFGDSYNPDTALGRDQRKTAKASTFKPLYAGRTGSEEARKYYQWFRDNHKEFIATQEGWIQEVLRTKKLKLCTGLTFYWQECHMEPNGYITHTQQIANAPVQYLASAEVLTSGLVYLWSLARDYFPNCRFINTIHDSVLVEVEEELAEPFAKFAVKILTEVPRVYMREVYGFDFDVPLEAEYKIGRNWS